MHPIRSAAIVLGAILAMPVAGFAAPHPALGQAKTTLAKSARAPKGVKSVANHSVKGIVKSINADTLVVERGSGKKAKEMTFALDNTTRREGEINVGSRVAVRYKNDASKLTALDIQPVNAKAAARKAAAR
jgi:uncharacterized protein DUF5666